MLWDLSVFSKIASFHCSSGPVFEQGQGGPVSSGAEWEGAAGAQIALSQESFQATWALEERISFSTVSF